MIKGGFKLKLCALCGLKGKVMVQAKIKTESVEGTTEWLCARCLIRHLDKMVTGSEPAVKTKEDK